MKYNLGKASIYVKLAASFLFLLAFALYVLTDVIDYYLKPESAQAYYNVTIFTVISLFVSFLLFIASAIL